MNGELFLAPLRRQDAFTSSREGTISTIEELHRLEAEEDAGTADPYREARHDDVETCPCSRALRNARSARALSRRLVEAGLLRALEPASGRRAALYAFDPLLDLLKV